MAKKDKKKKEKKTAVVDEKQPKQTTEKKQVSLLIIVPIIAILAVVGSIAGTILTNKFITPMIVVNKVEGNQSTGSGKISEDQVIVPMEEFLVNLAKDGEKKTEYMRITMSVLTNSEEDSLELTQNIAVVRDSIVNSLRQKTSGDILDTPESIASLKLELREVINNAYGKGIVGEVYITDFVIQ